MGKHEKAVESEFKLPFEKPHPMRKVPGYPREATWSKYQGRWVITRKTS